MLVLLDVDGVLNPAIQLDRVTLDVGRSRLVQDLALIGRIVWATTWETSKTLALGRELNLPVDTLSIAFPCPIHLNPHNPAASPKLHWVTRWLARTIEEEVPNSTVVVWIDDHLRADVTEWATAEPRPILLVTPDASEGLTANHVAKITQFLSEVGASRPAHSSPTQATSLGDTNDSLPATTSSRIAREARPERGH